MGSEWLRSSLHVILWGCCGSGSGSQSLRWRVVPCGRQVLPGFCGCAGFLGGICMHVCSQLRAFPASFTRVSSVGETGLTRVASFCIFLWRLAGGVLLAPDTAVFCRWCIVWMILKKILRPQRLCRTKRVQLGKVRTRILTNSVKISMLYSVCKQNWRWCNSIITIQSFTSNIT
ncbi:hypothetical protein JZ751_006470, partial [Albula glossodonta]